MSSTALADPQILPSRFSDQRIARRMTIHMHTQYGIEGTQDAGHIHLRDELEVMSELHVRVGERRNFGFGIAAGINGHPIDGHYDALFLLSMHLEQAHPWEITFMAGLDLRFQPEVRPIMRTLVHATMSDRGIAPALILTLNVDPDGNARNDILLGANVTMRNGDHLYVLGHVTIPPWNLIRAAEAHGPEQGLAAGISIMHIHDF